MDREFIIANTIKEAVMLKTADTVYIGGGTEINRLDSDVSYNSVISLRKLGLNEILVQGEYLKIGAYCSFQQLIENKRVPQYLKEACLFMGSRTKRNMATIGGNIASLRSDSYLIPTLVSVNAKLLLQNKYKDSYEIDLINYIEFNNDYKNDLILSVEIPREGYTVASKRCSNTKLSHAFITASMSKFGKKDYLIFAGLKNSGFSKFDALSVLLSQKNRVSITDVREVIDSTTEIKFFDDIFGSVEYKKYLLSVTLYDLYCEVKGGSK